MQKPEPIVQTVPLAEVRGKLDALVARVARKEARVVLERDGIPVAVIVAPDDLARLDRLDREREADFAVIDELREAFKDVPDEEIERETDRILGTTLAEVTAAR